MHRLMTVAASAAFLAVASFAALAAEVTGKITAVDAATHAVTMDDGHSYVMPADIDVADLKIGLEVTLTYEEKDGVRTVSALSSPG